MSGLLTPIGISKTCEELLDSHQAPPQVADRGKPPRYGWYRGNQIPGADQNQRRMSNLNCSGQVTLLSHREGNYLGEGHPENKIPTLWKRLSVRPTTLPRKKPHVTKAHNLPRKTESLGNKLCSRPKLMPSCRARRRRRITMQKSGFPVTKELFLYSAGKLSDEFN